MMLDANQSIVFICSAIAEIYRFPRLIGSSASYIMGSLVAYHRTLSVILCRDADLEQAMRQVRIREDFGPDDALSHYLRKATSSGQHDEDKVVEEIIQYWKSIDEIMELEIPEWRVPGG